MRRNERLVSVERNTGREFKREHASALQQFRWFRQYASTRVLYNSFGGFDNTRARECFTTVSAVSTIREHASALYGFDSFDNARTTRGNENLLDSR